MIKVLSSKKYPVGKRDRWWYNLSSPDKWIKHDTKIHLILNDESNRMNIGTIVLQLDKEKWFNRVVSASRHTYKGTEIIKVHVFKENNSKQYYVYFGKSENGIYPVNI